MSANPNDGVAGFDDLMCSRKTVRSFREDPVPEHLLREVIEIASRAPSTFNTQPWRVYLLAGEAKRSLSDAILEAHTTNVLPAFSPFPSLPPAAIASRQSDFGARYYGALGIRREDIAARAKQTGRNFEFFGAPVGLIFTIDSTLTKHSWLDCGLFLQNLMLAAHARGLGTCPQVSFARFQSVIAQHLGLASDEEVVCGMSLGYPDELAPVNHLEMPREPAEHFAKWLGFDR